MFSNTFKGVSPSKQRLLVVANRLPVSAKRKGGDSWSFETSAGGLVSGLLGVEEIETRWIGWAGVNVSDETGKKALTSALPEKCIPVFLDKDTTNQYFNGYSNNILWPLFHYLGLPQEDRPAGTWSYESQFAAYQKANRIFADVIINHYEEGDIVWCHDFHLMFLPKYLKEYNSNIKVKWFLHEPFPSLEVYRSLPSRSELLRTVLMADSVGFHTRNFARNFVSACTSILRAEGTPEAVEYQGRVTRLEVVCPIGIDSDFVRAVELPEVQKLIKEFKDNFSGKKVILSVERLDTINGIPHKLLAYEKFLEKNKYWRDKVALIQIGVPSDIPIYKNLKRQVDQIVGRIIARYGSLDSGPIFYVDRLIDFYPLCALYAISDVALATSMNLVSSEFVACQDSKKRVLMISEFARAAESLGDGGITVNPWNLTKLAVAIGNALDMPAEERDKHHRLNFEYVTTHTAQHWADFIRGDLKLR